MDGANLFSQVQFFIAQCDSSEEIKNLLIEGGAKQINYLSERVTHVIADTNCPAAEEAADLFDKPVVTSLWVHLSLKARRILPHEAFSPFRKIFHNVVASFSRDLSRNDISSLVTTVTYHGGRVTRQREHSTHFIVSSAKPSEFQDGTSLNEKLKMVAPDWILESVKQNICCDETLFDPCLLLPPPPPPPPKQPTPPPSLPPNQEKEKSMIERGVIKPGPQTSDNHAKNPTPQNENHLGDETPQKIDVHHAQRQIRTQSPSQNFQYQSQQQSQRINAMQTPQQSQVTPRARMPSNMIRGSQPRLRQTLPANVMQPRHHAQSMPRGPTDGQQPRKVLIDPNISFRKAGPYPANPDMQHMQQQSQQYQQLDQQQQQQGVMMNPNSRNPPPNMYPQQHVRPQYAPNNHMSPRMVNPQQMHRFHEPNSQMPQPRPYPAPHQQQPIANPNYQQGQMPRQPVYYNHNPGASMRLPQQGPMVRPTMISNDQQMISENHPQYPGPHQSQAQPLYVQQQHLNQSPRSSMQPQTTHPFQQPHPPVVAPSRIQFSPNIPNAVSSHPTRGPRQASNHSETKSSPRHASQNHDRAPRGPRAATLKSQPHPSIFDLKQDSSFSQMKAKVPDLSENIEYFSHADGFTPPAGKPFMACKFKLIDHEDVGDDIRQTWCDIIKSYGGQFVEDMEELTHIICETQATPESVDAIEKGVRCITMYWIKDVIEKDRLEPPWKALHVPAAFKLNGKPLKNHIVTTTNFSKSDRNQIKKMIELTGARYTDFMSSSNTLLICGRAGGEKFERAVEWRVSIANCQLLSDFLISGQDFPKLLDQAKYQNFNRGDPLKFDSYALIRRVMRSWTKPIPAPVENVDSEKNGSSNTVPSSGNSTEDSGVVTGVSNSSEPDTNKSQLDPIIENGDKVNDTIKAESGPVDRHELAETSKTEQQEPSDSVALGDSSKTNDEQRVPENQMARDDKIELYQRKENETRSPKQSITKKPPLRTSKAPIRILTTRLSPDLVSQLREKASNLGLQWAMNPNDSTHLLVDSISRSPNFVMAFSHASYILSYKWLVESHDLGQLLDETAYILHDPEGETKYSFNLVHSLLNRRRRPGLLFDNYIFFVTPTVTRRVKDIEKMIDSAGGRTETRKLPTRSQLAQIRAEGKRFVIVTYRHDYHLLHCIEPWGIDIVDAEFVISGILRQEIDFEAHRLDLRNAERQERLSMPIPSIPQPSPMKRLRQV